MIDTMRTVDELSKLLNARVVVPDLFDGKPYPLEKFPIKEYVDLSPLVYPSSLFVLFPLFEEFSSSSLLFPMPSILQYPSPSRLSSFSFPPVLCFFFLFFLLVCKNFWPT